MLAGRESSGIMGEITIRQPQATVSTSSMAAPTGKRWPPLFQARGIRDGLVNGNVTSRYLGLKFEVDGKTHYGWARLTVQLPGNYLINATLTGYAYETVPDKGILAGQTAGGADAAAVSSNSPDSDTSNSSASVANPSDTPRPTSLGTLALGAGGVPLRRRP
jgi:hypothetical protein